MSRTQDVVEDVQRLILDGALRPGDRLPAEKELATELGVTVDVKLVGRKGIERSEGKARRVVDRRKLE